MYGRSYFSDVADDEYYDDDEVVHVDRGRHDAYSRRRPYGEGFPSIPSIPSLETFVGGANRRLGFGLSISGGFVTFLGVVLFFNSFLLRIGNILFLSGLPMIIGPGRTVAYFTNPSRLRATATFLFGMFLVVFAGWPMTGLVVEVFGFLNLFGNLFPLLRMMLSQIPFIPGVGRTSNGMTQPREDGEVHFDTWGNGRR
jgi:hypothetical protein